MKQPLIVLTGPTAVGKTSLSIKLAKAIGGEIISADSMQVYRHMDIGCLLYTSVKRRKRGPCSRTSGGTGPIIIRNSMRPSFILKRRESC